MKKNVKRKKKKMLFKKLTDEEFTEQTEPVIFKFSLIVAAILSIVMVIFGLNFLLSFLISYVVSLGVFFKDNFVITQLLYQRLYRPKLCMNLNNLASYALYIGVMLLFVFVDYFTLWGIVGLFVMEITTIIVGIIYR